MKKKYCRFLASILSVTVLVTSIPFMSNATEEKSINNEKKPILNQEKREIVSELEEKRSADTKTFLMSDGSYLHAAYPEHVHYRENNEWIDVDNSFVTTSDDDGEKVLENKKILLKLNFLTKPKTKN